METGVPLIAGDVAPNDRSDVDGTTAGADVDVDAMDVDVDAGSDADASPIVR